MRSVRAAPLMKIATYNINNLARRQDALTGHGYRAPSPTSSVSQELKMVTENFPVDALLRRGYRAVWIGQKQWNGVAILAKGIEPQLTRNRLPGDKTDQQSRYIEAAVNGLLIASIYLPNGNPQPGPKFDYKLDWMKRLRRHGRQILSQGVPAVLAGDFNVAPTDLDIYPTTSWDDDAPIQPESRAGYPEVDQGWLGRFSAPAASEQSASIPSGITCGDAGREMPDCVSTICCSAPTCGRNCGVAVSTATCAASPAPAITHRPGST